MRSDPGELLSAVCGLGLLVCMFTFAWYGGNSMPGTTPRPHAVWTENAWQALPVGRWVMLATVVVAVGSLLLHLSQRSHGSRTNTSGLVAGLGAATAVLLIYRVLIDMPSANRISDQKLGAVLGTLLALGIAAGGVRSLREERRRPRERRRLRPRERRRARLASSRPAS
jgi:hypothetical protein